MPLDPLATTADLTDRGITHAADPSVLDVLLASASAEIRDAAGVPITRETFTVDIEGAPRQWLTLPGQPVVSVASVELDGEAVPAAEWRLVGGRLWRRTGWQSRWCEPSVVTVAVTGGLLEVPADIVDLVCAMVGAAEARISDGEYGTRDAEPAIRIDDYSEQPPSLSAATRLAGPMELPPATRRRLAARFGGSAHVIGTGA